MPIPHFKHSTSWRQHGSHPLGSARRSSQHRPPRRKRPRGPLSFKKLIAQLLPYAFIAAALGILFMLALLAWYSRDLPRPDKIIDRSVAQSTKIYDRTGEHLLFEVHGTERRTIIPLEEIPNYVVRGTILVEDKKFYNHGGFDLKGIARAVIKDILTLSKAEGASTLTQQLVKNALLSNEKAWSRKLKELVLAYQIERKFSKEQILQLYFNEIPYGSNAYGIESAAQLYFNKSAKDLTIAEGATLSAIPRATTFYSPFGSNVDRLLARKDFIISLLEDDDTITHEQAEAARSEEVVFAERANLLSTAPHFVIWVREQLAKEYGEHEVEQGGLRVITTLDWDMQQAAEESVAFYAERNQDEFDASNAALVAIDPKNGQVLAMVGSRDYFNKDIQGNFNVAVQGKLQPGSSFKPFVYLEGLHQGYTDKTTLWDVVTEFGKGADGKEYTPHNYDLKEHGPVSIRSALAGSLNIPAVKMLYLAEPRNVIKLAQQFGYTTLTDPDRYGLSLVLGGAEVTLLEHTNAYATLANSGIYHEYAPVLKVEDAQGKVLEEWKEKDGDRVIDEQYVNLLTNILSDNDARAPFFGANNFLTLGNRPVAGKTGTTNDYHDAWMMGYTPSLAAGVWVGNSLSEPMKRGAGGSAVAAPIWNRFMRNALSEKDIEQFPGVSIEYPDKPILRGDLQDGTPIRIDRASGLLATDLTPESFVEEKVFRAGHTILYYVDPENPAGPEPDENDRDGAYPKWEEAVQRWITENDWQSDEGTIPTESDNLHVFENRPSISILDPTDGQTLSNDIIFFRVEASAPRGISRVEFYVDDTLVAESKSAPYTGRYIPNTSTANGFHTLKAITYDDVDNSESAHLSFNLFLQKTNVSATWNKPAANARLSKKDFPVSLELSLPESLSKIELFAAPKDTPSQYTLIRTAQEPGTSISALWNNAPEQSGEYDLYAILWDQNNVAHRSDGVTVQIEAP